MQVGYNCESVGENILELQIEMFLHKTTDFWTEPLEINGTIFDVKKVVLPFQIVIENFYRNHIFKLFFLS